MSIFLHGVFPFVNTKKGRMKVKMRFIVGFIVGTVLANLLIRLFDKGVL